MKNFVVRQQDCCKSGNILILVCLYYYLLFTFVFSICICICICICSYKYKRNRTVVSGKSFWEPVKVFAFKENTFTKIVVLWIDFSSLIKLIVQRVQLKKEEKPSIILF